MASVAEQLKQLAAEEKAEVDARIGALEAQIDALEDQVSQGLAGLEVINELESIKAAIKGIYTPPVVEPDPIPEPEDVDVGAVEVPPTDDDIPE